jgi:hypothetical protein
MQATTGAGSIQEAITVYNTSLTLQCSYAQAKL